MLITRRSPISVARCAAAFGDVACESDTRARKYERGSRVAMHQRGREGALQLFEAGSRIERNPAVARQGQAKLLPVGAK